MKKAISAGISALLLAGYLTGCGKSEIQPGDVAGFDEGEILVSMWVHTIEDTPEGEAYKKSVRSFNENFNGKYFANVEFIPRNDSGGGYSDKINASVIKDTDFIRYMLNTLFYAAILIVAGVIVNGLAGYALAKIKFPFRERWVFIIMMLMIVPSETIITINFLFVAKMGLLNTIFGYILPMIVNPFNIFLFRQVFVSLPDDVWEAAQLDYCSPVKYFFTMVLPMSKTVVATVSVFTFLGVWNDYLWPSLVFTSSDLLTAQIGLNSITSNDNTTMGQTLAVITMITIPVIIIYALFSKQIVEGVVSTGSKEG